MLQIQSLQYQYSSGPKLEFPNFEFGKGDRGLILGESGCGKTTLLQLLGGLRKPAAGTVKVNRQDLQKLDTTALDRFRGRHIGFIFQQAHAVQALTVGENLALARQLAGVSQAPAEDEAMLARLGLAQMLQRKPEKLSQGERQRLAIARALVNRPSVILADEPTSALDDKNTEAVAKLLIEQADSVAATLLVVTHDARLKGYFSKQIQLKKQVG
jgi:putative ABC transport system ATP-binding protein